MRFVDKDLLSVQEARILMENAGEARKVLAGFEQERLDRIVDVYKRQRQVRAGWCFSR